MATQTVNSKTQLNPEPAKMLFGVVIGLIIGLGIALVVAYTIIRNPPVEKQNVRTPDIPIVPKIMPDGTIGESRDINSPLRLKGKNAEAADVSSSTDAPPVVQALSPPQVVDTKEASPGVTYWLQVGAYTDKAAAETEKAGIAMQGLQARISEVKNEVSSIWRVRIGPFVSLQEMQSSKSRLDDAGVYYSVIKANK